MIQAHKITGVDRIDNSKIFTHVNTAELRGGDGTRWIKGVNPAGDPKEKLCGTDSQQMEYDSPKHKEYENTQY